MFSAVPCFPLTAQAGETVGPICRPLPPCSSSAASNAAGFPHPFFTAAGVRMRRIPLTPERVLAALKKA
jgi:hypothetical protein